MMLPLFRVRCAVLRRRRFKGSTARHWRSFAAGFLFALAGILPTLPANASTPAVGTLPGSFGVTPTGAATYTIPIALPRGSGGLTPSIALVYNSQSGSGAVGWGWTLAGLSAITRCPKTIVDDGVTQAIQLQSTDDYCLDGQRLRVTSGTSGGSATYDTELRGYSQITSYTGSPTGGPSYWTVQTKNGTTYEYGNTTDSRIFATDPGVGATTVVRVWALDKVTDANGNYYAITYQNSDATTGDYWPLAVAYSGNNNKPSSPDHTVTFGWNPRSDTSVHASFLAGTLVTQTQLLSTITVSYNSTPSLTYYLTYQIDSNNGRNQLKQVQECAPDQTGSCFSPTLIGWQPAGAPGWQSPQPVSGLSGLTYDEVVSTHLVDVNGDGIADLLFPGYTGSQDWMVLFGQAGGGFGSPVNTGVPIGSNYLWALATDANGDGRMDLMVPGTSTWTVYEATGNTSGTIFNAVASGLSDTGTNSVTGAPIYEGNAALADYSGRGLGDFLYSDGTNIYLVPNSGPTSNPQFGTAENMGALGNFTDGVITRQGVFSGVPLDFDGSSRGGRLALTITTYSTQCNPQDQPGCTPGSTTKYDWWPLLSTPSGYTASLGSLVCWSATMTPLPLDATGGGLTDLLYSCPATNVYDVALSTGTGLTVIPTTIPYTGTDPVLADYYGDGREEALTQDSSYSSGWALIRVNYDPSTASFVTAVGEVPAPLPSNYVQGSLQVGPIEPGGFNDLVFAEFNGSTYSIDYELHNLPSPVSGVPNTVTNIKDGLGNSWSPSYAMLTNTSSYAEGSGAIYPNQDVKAPFAVVTSYVENDGIGGSYTVSYSYANGEQEVTGRGFLGFGSRTVTDSRNGVMATEDYAQTYPWIGALTSESVTQSNGDVLSATTNTYAPSGGCTGGALCFPYLSQSAVTENDVLGNPLRTVTTANNSVDSYGDVLDRTVTIVDKSSGPTNGQTFTTETVTGYADDASSGAYCIDLPTSVSITRTTPAGSLTRSSASPQDPTACRPASVTLNQGGSPTLTTAYGYDNYGNPATITSSGTLLTTRATTADYSTYNGEYPNKVTNALSQISTETWDPSRGVETSMTDPNGHETQWAYDGFGRKTGETFPAGLTLGLAYDACGASLNGQALGSPANCAYAVGETSNAQSLPVAATLYDSKDRAIQTEKWLLGGVVSGVTTAYDALGRATAVSKPYLSGAANEYWTHTNYDVLNRPVQITGPAYQSDTSSDCDVTKLGYSGFTTTATETAPTAPACGSLSTEQTVTTTDALGEIISKTDGSGTAQATTAYTYDPFGELHITKDADGNITTINYDALGHKANMTDPNMGYWTYTEDALGELLNQTDAKGQVIQQTFDVLGRRTSKEECTAACGSGTVTASDTWTYDTAANGIGLLASESDSVSGFSRTYSYNSLSQPSEADTTIPGTSTPYAVNTTYDSLGRVATVTYPASVAPSAPVASAVASPTSAVVGNNIALNGSGSTDPNGLTLSYQWSGLSGVSIANPTAETTTVTSSTPGAYTVQLVVSDQNASSTPATVNVTFSPPAPGAPSTSPNPSTTGSYTVSWSGVTGASSYEVYQSTDGTNYSDLGSVSGISDSLSGRSDGSYYYKVAACENNVCGPLSAASSAESVLLPPVAPTNLTASPNPSTNGSFTLSWNSAATATSYKVFLSGNGTPVGTPTTTSFSTSEGDGSYSFYVEACNNGGCSGASASVSETVTLPPNTPATPSASPNPSTTGNFTVSWSAPSSTWTSMQFQESPDQSSWTTEATSGTSWSASGFGNGTYYFRTTYCDESACSTSGTGSVLVTLPPGVPGSVSLSPNPSSNGSYTLSWGVSSGTVTAYDVYSSGGAFITSTTATSTSFSGEVDGSYGYYVTACNQSACSGQSSTVTETVLHVPGVPPSVSASPTSISTGGYFTLFWGTSSGSVGYYVAIGSGAGSTHYSASTHSAVIYPGRTGTDLYYVQACNASGCSADSNSASVTVSSGGGGCKLCSPTTSPQSTTPSSPNSSPTPAPSASSGGGLMEAGLPVEGLARLAWTQDAPPSALRESSATLSSTSSFGKGGPGRIFSVAHPVHSSTPTVLTDLAEARAVLAGHLTHQPSEVEMQGIANARERAQLPSLLPPATAEDVSAWNDWNAAYKQAHPNGPEFAPPEYIAYAGVKLEPASSSTYRFEVQYNYDSASGALVSVANAQTGFVYWQVASGGAAPVDAFGHLLGWTDGNNVSTVMAYDQATGAPVGISSGIGQSSAVQSLVYTWDGYGNLEERQDANQSNLYETLSYDDLNRLSTSTVTNSAGNGPGSQFYYDAVGDIQKKIMNGVTSQYSYADASHPYAVTSVTNIGGGTYSATYDGDGNMVSRNGYPIQWTPSNLPSSIASASGSSTFNYGPDGNRYSQSATFNGNTTATAYIGSLFEVVSTSTTTEYRHNILADGQIVAVHTIDQNGSAYTDYLHYDHLGSVDAITNDSGSVIQTMSFDAFGLRRDASNWDYDLSQNQIGTLKNYTDRGYTDQEQLDNLTLVDLNGRVYDPTVGRFISADPKVPAPANCQAFNRYSYVYDNPLIYKDPSGYDPGSMYSDFGMSGPQNAQDISEMQQIQASPQYQIQIAEQGLATTITFTSGSVLMIGAIASAATPGAEEAAPELVDASITAFSATDAVAAFLNSAAITYGLTQGSADMLTSLTDTDQVNVLDDAFGQTTGDYLTAGLSAWDWANILGKPKSTQAAIDILDKGLNFLNQKTQPPKSGSPTPQNPIGGGGEGNHNWSASHIICITTYYDWYSGSPGGPGYYQFTTSVTECN